MTATAAPSAASAWATAAPIPLDAPVTIATLPANFFISMSLSFEIGLVSLEPLSDLSACPRRYFARGCGCRNSLSVWDQRKSQQVLLQQIERRGKQDEVLHQEGDFLCHGGKAAGRCCPAVRHKRNDRCGTHERRNSAKGAKDARRLVPESYEYQCPKGPFRDAEEPASTSDSENRIHPGDERSVTDVRNERLGLVLEPLLISKEEEYQDHRRAKHVIVDFAVKDPVPLAHFD